MPSLASNDRMKNASPSLLVLETAVYGFEMQDEKKKLVFWVINWPSCPTNYTQTGKKQVEETSNWLRPPSVPLEFVPQETSVNLMAKLTKLTLKLWIFIIDLLQKTGKNISLENLMKFEYMHELSIANIWEGEMIRFGPFSYLTVKHRQDVNLCISI